MLEDMINVGNPQQLQDNRYFAHIRKDGGKLLTESLLAHSQLTLKYFNRYCSRKGLGTVVQALINACGFSDLDAEKVSQHLIYAIYLHDLGKINPRYQSDVLKNRSFYRIRGEASNANHSLASSYMFLDYIYRSSSENLTPAQEKCLAAFAYCISKHHGKLGNGHDFSELEGFDEGYFTSDLDSSIFENVRFYLQKQRSIEQPLAFYILCRVLYALIVGCDYCATQEFMTGWAMEPTVINAGGEELIRRYEETEIVQWIRKYQRNPASFIGDPINALRNQLFIEAEGNLLAHPNAHFYYLEAPTGAGKTNIAINLSLRILQMDHRINNIFYVFPFNTLVEQTKEVLMPIFGDMLAVLNSITPVVVGGDDGKENYDAAWLDHIFNNYPIVLTSHINFFNALFGCGRAQTFPLLKLCNSVIVLDEIQSYKNSIWREIICFLQQYARLLNMKIIIMSATLPQLDKMLNTIDAQFVSLIADPLKYYHDPLFRNRVKLDFSMLEEPKITLEQLKEAVFRFQGRRVLVEFIKKKTAWEFYLLCKDDCNAVLLTGDDNAARRDQIIQRIHSGENIILIATQVIEAGIDIDMEIGFKDISFLDAEEQFLGRINRSCRNAGDAAAYFFNYNDAAEIYKGDVRLRYSIKNPVIQKILQEKCFTEFYACVFADLISKTSRSNENNLANINKNCAQLNFREIEEHMRLIEPSLRLFVPYICGDLDGYQTWNEFKALGANIEMAYSQRMVEYSRLALKMSYFTFQVFRNKVPAGAEEYGGYFFIDGGERFIEDGILNRTALDNYYGGIFL